MILALLNVIASVLSLVLRGLGKESPARDFIGNKSDRFTCRIWRFPILDRHLENLNAKKSVVKH